MTFGQMNDSYYQPSEDRHWDRFVDDMTDQEIPEDEWDFEAWCEVMSEPDPDFDRQYELENFED